MLQYLQNFWKFRNPLSPYRRTSRRDRAEFRELLSIWKPPAEQRVVLLRWQLTRWCNYSCPYCPQKHERHAPLGENHTAHAFDNYPVDQWVEAFRRHFAEQRATLVLTGGEPMLDRRSMPELLQALTTMKTVECIRIDTNARWDPQPYREIDRGKLILMCTFHPSEIEEAAFLRQLDVLMAEGFEIGQVNYVFTRENMREFERRWELFREKGIALYPNPLWGPSGYYDADELALLGRYLPKDVDYKYRARKESPQGQRCLFPAIGYQMDAVGRIQVGCHPSLAGSFFNADLPELFDGPVPCPMIRCGCIDMYSFLEGSGRVLGVNPLADHRRELLALDPNRELPLFERGAYPAEEPAAHANGAEGSVD